MAKQMVSEPVGSAEGLAAMYHAIDFLLEQEIERSRTGIGRADTYGRAESLRDELHRVVARQP